MSLEAGRVIRKWLECDDPSKRFESPHARYANGGSGRRIFTDHGILYSYGFHFPLARKYLVGGLTVIAYNAMDTTRVTAGHRYILRQTARTKGIPTVPAGEGIGTYSDLTEALTDAWKSARTQGQRDERAGQEERERKRRQSRETRYRAKIEAVHGTLDFLCAGCNAFSLRAHLATSVNAEALAASVQTVQVVAAQLEQRLAAQRQSNLDLVGQTELALHEVYQRAKECRSFEHFKGFLTGQARYGTPDTERGLIEAAIRAAVALSQREQEKNHASVANAGVLGADRKMLIPEQVET